MEYTKLSNLIDGSFTVEKIWGYKFKMFDQDTKKMVSDDKWFRGARKVYEVDTDKGKMDLGQGQIGTLLETVMRDGISELYGKTFSVKSNGETGIDIRYFFDEVKPSQYKDDEMGKDAVDFDDIPF